MKKISDNQIKLLILGSVTVLVIIIIAYPIYAQKYCSNKADQYASFTKEGEIYLSQDGVPSIKLSEYNKLCLNKRFGL